MRQAHADPMTDFPSAVPASAQATSDTPALALPPLHRQLVERLGARASALVEAEPGGARLIVTSGHGTGAPDGTPIAPADAAAVEALLAAQTPQTVPDLERALPSLARLLRAPAGLVLRLPGPHTAAALVVGLPAGAQPDAASVAAALEAFAVGVEWLRLRRARGLQRRVHELVLAFSRGLSAMPDLAAGLDALCRDAADALGVGRVEVWLHDRRAHELVLEGSSDPTHGARRVSTDDHREPAVRGLRLDVPELTAADAPASAPARLFLLPLRGRRRALGTLVLEDPSGPAFERATLAEAARDLGSQLSNAIENLQLLAEVLRSRRELENTFNSLVELVAVCDRGGRLTSVNGAFAARVGARAEQLADRPFASLVGPGLAALVAAQTEADAAEPVEAREIDDPALDGTFSVTVTPLVNHDDRRVGTVVVARDVTERVRLEAERAALRQQLQQSEKLAALGQFVAGIAHELNNPLQGVIGHLELLRETGQLTASQKRDVRVVYREAERAARIVRHLLLFAGSGRHDRRRYKLGSLLARALAVRARALRRAHIEVRRAFDARIPWLVGSPVLLHQAILNIVVNAEHAMAGTGGRLEVSTRLSANGTIAIVEIRDTGPGLSEEAERRLFEPFFTTKDVGKGTGLGLALTYGIVQDHGGAIRARNHRQGGAAFTIELPITPKKRQNGDRVTSIGHAG